MGFFKKQRVYLDAAAASPVRENAWKAFSEASSSFGNPSSPHAEGQQAKNILEDARTRIAGLVEVKSDAVIFTGNATEANAIAIEGHIRALHDAGHAHDSMHVLYLPSSHASVIGAIETIQTYGVSVEPIAISGTAIDLDALKKQLRPETVLVCVDAVCGETGVRFDTRGVRRILDATYSANKREARPVLHIDASQLPLVESISRMRLGADTLALDAQKVGGVRGIGALIAPSHVAISPLVRGGGQERGIRPGTESPALAAAFAKALEESDKEREVFSIRARSARMRLSEHFLTHIPDSSVIEGKEQAPHILNISLIARDTDYLVALLDAAGFAVSTKSACETDEAGSRAVLTYTNDSAKAASTLRISWNAEITENDLMRFAEECVKAVTFLDAHAL